MKPRADQAMAELINRARREIPFKMSFDGFCVGRCDECPEKLLEFLDVELSEWEYRLQNGAMPKLGDVTTVAVHCKKVFEVLEENGLV